MNIDLYEITIVGIILNHKLYIYRLSRSLQIVLFFLSDVRGWGVRRFIISLSMVVSIGYCLSANGLVITIIVYTFIVFLN